jgi:hypothetical protein
VPVVDDRQVVLVLHVPQRVVGVVERADVVRDHVRPPADPGRVRRVRDAVLPVLVVPGVLELGPAVDDVRDVLVIERLHELGGDHLPDLVVGREVDVVVQRAGGDLAQRLLGVVEGRELDVDAVLRLEVLHDARIQVVGVVVELEGAALLGGEPRLDHRHVAVERPLDRVVGAGDLEPLGAGHLRLAARSQQGRRRDGGTREQSGAQQPAPGDVRCSVAHETSRTWRIVADPRHAVID